MKRTAFRALLLLAVFVMAEPAAGRVVRVEVRSRSDLLGGKAFGLAGPYESHERYLGLFAEAAMRQVRERFLLPEDLADVLSCGAAQWDAAIK